MRISVAVNSFDSQAYINGQLQRIRKEDLTAYEIYVVNSRVPIDKSRLYVPETLHSHTGPSGAAGEVLAKSAITALAMYRVL